MSFFIVFPPLDLRFQTLMLFGVLFWFLGFPMNNMYLDPSLQMLFQCSPTPSYGVLIWSHSVSSLSLAKSSGGVVRDILNPDLLRPVSLSYSAMEGNGAAPLPRPITEGGITRVMIPQDAYENRLKLFQFSMTGRFDSRGVLMEDIEKQVKAHKGFYIFRLFSNKDMLTVGNVVGIGLQCL
ncbi:hypothetical protein NE237_016305 [Protea cynaroides]|uniref:Uncharacterized protein n=1 Tax=Protea cynaroides TaxID=273540 RepID=A0A9Q0JTL0_9MAGN|nr:hypothetical protein NE237_016305 [Protea cynaroides]